MVGIKDSSGDMAFMMRMISAVRPHRPDFTFLTGWEAVLVPMLADRLRRRHARLQRMVPELTRSIYDLPRAGQFDEAMRLQYRLLELFDTMLYSADFPEGFRAAVELRGSSVGPGRSAADRSQQVDFATLAERAPVPLWPNSALSIRPRAVARRARATSARTASVTSRPPCLKICTSEA